MAFNRRHAMQIYAYTIQCNAMQNVQKYKKEQNKNKTKNKY